MASPKAWLRQEVRHASADSLSQQARVVARDEITVVQDLQEPFAQDHATHE